MDEFGTLDTVIGSGTLNEISGLLEQAWSSNSHVPDDVRVQVGIAVGEIGANIVEYAGRPARMRMEVCVRPNEVEVTFTDDGAPVMVDLASVRMPNELAESGRGLALAQAVLEQLNYCRDLVNRWTLVSKQFA